METLVGTTLGGYTLTHLLGSGGMGTVYLAEDRTIGQQVAVKVVRTDDSGYAGSSSPAQTVERFKQEARAVAGLDHLHILPLFRYGEEETPSGRRAFMVMQYRPEGSLWDWLRRRAEQAHGETSASLSRLPSGLPTTWPISVEEAADYLQQAASALQYAHDRGILHRDVKPANFLLRFDTSSTGKNVFLLLSDFGLAKFFSSISSSSHTLGTPTYMAPEQFEGVPCPETDQYALAIMIYGLLAGRPPFDGDPMRLMHQHLTAEPPPIRTYAPTLSAGVEGVLTRALAKKPHQRFPSITAFAEAFAQNMYKEKPSNFSSTRQIAATNHLSPSGNYGSLAVQGQKLANQHPAVQGPSAFVSTVYQPPETPRHAQTQGSPVPSSPMQEQGASAPTVYSPVPTPSLGSSVPSSADDRLVTSLPKLSAEQMEQTSEPDEQPMNRRSALGWIIAGVATVGIGMGAGIYFYERRKSAHVKSILRGHTAEVTSVAWSPDSSQLVSGARDRTARIWSGSTLANTQTYMGHHFPILATAWHPDGVSIASGGRDNMVQVWTTTGTQLYSFPSLGSAVNTIAWNAKGRLLFVGTQINGLYEITLRTQAKTKIGLNATIRTLALSPNGRRYLAVGLASGEISITDLLAIGSTVFLPAHTAPVLSLAWSPDGTMLASGSRDNVIQITDIATNTIVHSFPYNSPVSGIAWEPGGTGRFATTSTDGSITIWNVHNGSHISYKEHAGPVTSIAWGANALATGSADTNIVIWEV